MIFNMSFSIVVYIVFNENFIFFFLNCLIIKNVFRSNIMKKIVLKFVIIRNCDKNEFFNIFFFLFKNKFF